MSQESICPLCGGPIPEARLQAIQQQARDEEQAKFDGMRAALEADVEHRIADAVEAANRASAELSLRQETLQSAELATLQAQLAAAHAAAADLSASHREAVVAAQEGVRAELDAKIADAKQRESEALEQLKELRELISQMQASHQVALDRRAVESEEIARAQVAAEVEQLRTNAQKSAERVSELELQHQQSELKFEHELSTIQSAHEDARRLAEAEAEQRVRDSYMATVAAANEENARLSSRLMELESQMRGLAEASEAKLQSIVSEAGRRHAEELLGQRVLLDEAKANEMANLRREFAEQQEALRKKLQEAERKIDQKTANELGHWPEVDLVSALHREFPTDEVQPIAKGVAGADVIHIVRYNGRPCGKIVIDSKNRQQWRESFAEKLAADQLNAEAQHAILSTNVFPQGVKDLSVHKDVILAKPNQVVSLVDLLRRTMIAGHIAGLSRADEGRKKDRLYQLINSDIYRQMCRNAEKACSQIGELDEDEYQAHRKVWESRGKMRLKLEKLLRDINGSIAAIVEGIDGVAPVDDHVCNEPTVGNF